MNQFVQDARQQLEMLQVEREQMNDQLKRLDSQIDALKTYIALATGENVTSQLVSQAAMSRKLSVREQVLEGVTRLLSDGKSMHTSDLLAALEGMGVQIGAADKKLAVSSILSRDPRFQANRKIGWSLRKNESPAVSEASESPSTDKAEPN